MEGHRSPLRLSVTGGQVGGLRMVCRAPKGRADDLLWLGQNEEPGGRAQGFSGSRADSRDVLEDLPGRVPHVYCSPLDLR